MRVVGVAGTGKSEMCMDLSQLMGWGHILASTQQDVEVGLAIVKVSFHKLNQE
jgi:hypothetical protein